MSFCSCVAFCTAFACSRLSSIACLRKATPTQNRSKTYHGSARKLNSAERYRAAAVGCNGGFRFGGWYTPMTSACSCFSAEAAVFCRDAKLFCSDASRTFSACSACIRDCTVSGEMLADFCPCSHKNEFVNACSLYLHRTFAREINSSIRSKR